MTDVYQEIWSADMSGAGLPAVRPGEVTDPNIGYVVVDERSATVGTEHRVLADVKIPEHKIQTYKLCERIFDNYALERAATEVVRPEESQEELDLIDAIVPTPPMQVARAFLGESLGVTISNETLAAMTRETWFAFGSAGNQRDATGFEHVFVGEQASRATKVGGYHFWYKYFLDDGGRTVSVDDTIGDGVDRLEYRGTRYQGADHPDHGLLVPEVVTLSLVWNAPSGDGGASRVLEKPIGGFFVGLSPEGLIAMGLVRARTTAGKTARINGATYQLDLHRLDQRPNSIRTFFPRFKSADATDVQGDAPATGGSSEGPFRIVAAMVNPPNPEGGREFLQIINQSAAAASLVGWKIVAPNGTTFTLADRTIAPGEVFRFVVPMAQGVLRNSSGDIRLASPGGAVAQTCSYSSAQAQQEARPILFP